MMFFFEVGEYVMEDSSAVEAADVTCKSLAKNYRYWSKIVRLLSHAKRVHVQNWWYKTTSRLCRRAKDMETFLRLARQLLLLLKYIHQFHYEIDSSPIYSTDERMLDLVWRCLKFEH